MIKVMIVDDEPFIRQGLKILINWEQYGFEICGEAANGKEATELMKNGSYDLIITDIKMPLMDGLELIEYTWVHISKQIRFILLSGFYEFDYAKKAIKYDVADYILKPVQREELIKTLEDYKELYYRQMENQRKLEFSDKIVFDRYLTNLIEGRVNKESCDYVKKFLTGFSGVRYISIEFDTVKDGGHLLSDEEKSNMQNILYDLLKNYLGNHWYHAYREANRNSIENSVDFIYTDKLTRDTSLSERDYLNKLYKHICSVLPYRITLYIGQKVERIEAIADSYKSAGVAKYFQSYYRVKDMIYYDDIKGKIGTNKQLVDKELMDGLVRSIEEYNFEDINRRIDSIFEHFKELLTEPAMIKINLDYILFNMMNIAKDLDPYFDQEDIYNKISRSDYEKMDIVGCAKYFKNFSQEFSLYLCQLRQHALGGVLKEIEKEIAEHYMDNLTLKFMSEKYYINSAYLGQIFKKQFGNSFKEYVNSYRIDRAAELLIRTDEKIYLVASAVGFNNTDYFISKFVELKGRTPLQYRKQSMRKQRR